MDYKEKDFGMLLRALRESQKMSQKELAEKAGIAPSYLNKIEKGLRMPSDEILFRLADVLVADELFIAAGKLIPPEFEKKHPLKELPNRLAKNEEIPNMLKNLFSMYETNFRQEIDNYHKKENEVRTLERMVSSWGDLYAGLVRSIKENYPDILQKIDDLLSTVHTLLNLYDQLNRLQRELELIALEKGHARGQRFALPEVWEEIKQKITINPTEFLQECLGVEKEDAEFILDFIELRKKRQKPPTDE